MCEVSINNCINCTPLYLRRLSFEGDWLLKDGGDATISERLMGGTGDVHLSFLCELEMDCSGEVNTAEKLLSSWSLLSNESGIGDDTVDGGGEGKGRTGT